MVIPTYNERDNLADLVEQLLGLPLPQAWALSVIVVDDASPDGTGAIADRLRERYPDRVQVVHRADERGRASAGLAGFRAALADPSVTHVGEMDADFSHHPGDLASLLDAAGRADVAIGSRYVRGGVSINCPLISQIRSRLICMANQVLFGLPVRDNSGGYKIYARRVLEHIRMDNFVSRAYTVGLETLVKCRNGGFSFAEVPITFRNRERGVSKLDRRVLVDYPLTIARLWWRSLRTRIS